MFTPPIKEILNVFANESQKTTGVSFDIALFTVSSLLSEARLAEEIGNEDRAEHYFALAEWRALHSGFLELVRLVWIDRKPGVHFAFTRLG